MYDWLAADASAVAGQCEPVTGNGTADYTTSTIATTTTASASASFARWQQATVTFSAAVLTTLAFTGLSAVMGNR